MTEIVTVILVHREQGEQDVVSVGGVFSRRELAEEQFAKLRERFPDESFNLVDVFMDAGATLYPGFRINPRLVAERVGGV